MQLNLYKWILETYYGVRATDLPARAARSGACTRCWNCPQSLTCTLRSQAPKRARRHVRPSRQEAIGDFGVMTEGSTQERQVLAIAHAVVMSCPGTVRR